MVNTVNDLTIHFDPLYLPVSVPALFLPINLLIVYQWGLKFLKKISRLLHFLGIGILSVITFCIIFPIGAYAAPSAPTHLKAEVFQNYIEISWQESDSAFSYTVLEKSTNQGEYYPVATLFKGTTTYKDYAIMNGRVYTYRARTFYSSSPSAYTDEVEVVVYYPSFLKINRSLSHEVDIEWSYPSLALSRRLNHQIILERRLHNTDAWVKIAQLSADETSYRDSDVNPDSLYYYRVRALFSNGHYSYFIPSEWGLSTRTAYPLTSSLYGYAVSDNTIVLEWDMSKADGGKAILEKKDATGAFSPLYTTETGSAYADYRLTRGYTYTYRLKLQSKNGSSSEYTEEVSIVAETVPYPKDFEVLALTNERVALSWSYPYEVETGFEVWRKGSGFWERLATLPKNTETFIDTSVSNGQGYSYKVRAIRGKTAFSPFSQEKAVVSTKPLVPGALVYYAENNILHLYSAEEVPSGTVYTLEIREGLNKEWLDYKAYIKGTLLANIHYQESSELRFRIRANRGALYAHSPELAFFGKAPDPVQGLKAESVGFDSVILSWLDMGDKEEGYHIYRTINSKRQLIGQVGMNGQRFTDETPIEGAIAQYEVLAYNASGQSTTKWITVTVPKALQFTDIASFKWAHEAIYGLMGKGALTYDTGFFYPQATMTRGQMTRIILKGFGLPYNTQGLFTLADVSTSHPYYMDLMAAINLGLIHPDTQGRVYPDQAVTRKEIVLTLNNALNTLDVPLNVHSTDNLLDFADYHDITRDEAPIMASFIGDGIITGKSGRLLSMNTQATRAEGVTIIYRTLITYLK